MDIRENFSCFQNVEFNKNVLPYSFGIIMFFFLLVIPVVTAICDICYRGSLVAPYKPIVLLTAILLVMMHCVSHYAKKQGIFESENSRAGDCGKVISSMMMMCGVLLPMAGVIYELCNQVDAQIVNLYKISMYSVFALYIFSLLLPLLFPESFKSNNIGSSADEIVMDREMEFSSYGSGERESLLSDVNCVNHSSKVVQC